MLVEFAMNVFQWHQVFSVVPKPAREAAFVSALLNV